jgi:hypothetical protein
VKGRGTILKGCAKISIPLVAGILLLSSCIEVTEKVTVNADGTGVVDLSYQVASMVQDLPPQTGTNGLLPLPADPTKLQTALQGAPGLTLTSFKPVETSRSVGADVTVRFNTVDDLNRALSGFSPSVLTLLATSGLTTFTQNLYPGNPNGVSPETLQVMKDLFANYRLSFTLQAPRPIQSVSMGTISSDKSTASYTTTVPDIIQSTTPVVWEVSW